MKRIITFIILSTFFTTSAYAWQVNGSWGGAASYGVGGDTYNYSYFINGDSLTTDNITETSHKYWHDYLLYQTLAGHLYTDNVTESSGHLYFTPGRTDTRFVNLWALQSSDNITEGSNKLFFTNGRARAVLSAGTGIGYDSGTGIITATGGAGTWGSITGTITSQTDLAPWFRDRFVQYYNLQTLDNVTDVVITNPTNGQVLTYSSGNWINSTPSGAGAVTWGSITGTLSTQADLYSQLIQPGALTKVLFGDKTWQSLYYDNITGGGSLSAKDITFTGALSHSTTNGIAYFYGNKLYTGGLVTDNVTEGVNKYWHDGSVFSALTGKLYYDNITDSTTIHPFTDIYRNYLNQSVANTASPTFAGLTTSAITTGTLYASAPVTFANSITTPLSGYMKATASGVITAANINMTNLGDTNIVSPTNNQVLTYNGSQWVNAAAQGGGGGGSSVAFDNFTLKTGSNGVTKVADRIEENIFMNALRISANASMSAYQMVDGIVDKFKDNNTISLTGSGGVSAKYIWNTGNYMPTASSVDNSALLIVHADGSGSTFVDSSSNNNTINVTGVTQSATQSKFGGKSAYFDGSAHYLSIPSQTYFNFGNYFTIDFWIYLNSTAGQYVYVKRTGGSDHSIEILYSSGTLKYSVSSNGTSYDVLNNAPCGSISQTTWTHIALVRNGSNWRCYNNGVYASNNTSSATIYSNSAAVLIGADVDTSGPLTGYLDEYHISSSVIWTDNFTPPTVAYVMGGGVLDNMTLVSNSTAALSSPTQGRFMVLQEQLDPTAVVNTDWKAYVTNDNGTNWNQVTLASEGNYSDNVTMYSGTAAYTGTSTGMRWKLQTFNKNNMFRGIGYTWN